MKCQIKHRKTSEQTSKGNHEGYRSPSSVSPNDSQGVARRCALLAQMTSTLRCAATQDRRAERGPRALRPGTCYRRGAEADTDQTLLA